MEEGLKSVIEVMRRHGSDLSVHEDTFLRVTVDKCRVQAGAWDMEEYCRLLMKNRAEADVLKKTLQITYSCFFREPFSFAIMERLLPAILDRRDAGKEVRIWVAGCAGGQEAYSAAMLMEDILSARKEKTEYRIFATDLSRESLLAAKAGIYRPDALENVRYGHVQKYFFVQGDVFSVLPDLKKKIDFSLYDLLDAECSHPPGSIFGGFDIVFCRNVLLYYRPEIRRFMIKRLTRSMAEGGYIVVGEAEKFFGALADELHAPFPWAPVYMKKAGRKTGS